MESKNRNVWIIVAVAVSVVLACCCVVAVAAAGVGWFASQPYGRFVPEQPGWMGPTSLQSERSEQTFVVGSAPSLEIDSSAGNVSVRAGESGVIRVVATKRAPRTSDLERIEVRMSEHEGGVEIKAQRPSFLSNVAVDLEITTPAGTDVDVHTGAGNVSICCLKGAAQVSTGAGNIDLDDQEGQIDAHTGAGNIDYQGTPQGDSRFEVGAGNITLVLPADLSMEVELQTGMGNIDVDFPVDGQATGRRVQGAIGGGTQGSIYAQTGAGNIDLIRR